MGRLTEAHMQDLLRAGTPVAGKSDGSGLTFTISKGQVGTQTGTWELRYRHAGRAHWLTLGRYPALNLKAARLKAGKERARIAEGTAT